MSVVEAPRARTNGSERHAAAETWRESAAAGQPMTGTELGERYGRSPRWGRQVIAEVQLVDEPGPAAAAGTPQGAPPAVRRVTVLAVVVVALVAAVASFDHQRQLAAAAGEDWRAWLLPLSVDGLVVAASMTMLARRRAGLPAGALAWVSLLLGAAASLAANVAAAEPTIAGRLVAAWPPVALLLGFELLLGQGQRK